MRHDQTLRKILPVTLHVNYHSNKFERMVAAEKFWVDGDDTELMKMPIGS